MDVLTIAEAASTTGWSARMLRYLEQSGLVTPRRSDGGYRLYGPAQIGRLRSLKQLTTRWGIGPAELAFVARMRSDPALGAAVQGWFGERAGRPDSVPDNVPNNDRPEANWLRFEQEKHERLLAHQTTGNSNEELV